MNFSLTDIKILSSILDNIKQYSDTFKLQITNESLHIQSIDNAKICILDFVINKDYFNSFNIDKTYNLDFDITDITKIFKVINKTRLVTFCIYDECNLKINIEPLDDSIKKIFKITSLSSNNDFLNIDSLTINNNFIINSKQLSSIFNELNVFAEDINISINNLGLQFVVNNDNIKSKFYIENITSEKEIESYFSLKYLAKFKLISLFENVNLKLDNDKPILLNINDKHFDINFILSPKLNI
tara:strand:- start:178 stop:903 length:726 start_codon:yes stop_codon:yes gene_type:complete